MKLALLYLLTIACSSEEAVQLCAACELNAGRTQAKIHYALGTEDLALCNVSTSQKKHHVFLAQRGDL